MIVASLSEKYGRPYHYFFQQLNVVQVKALVDIIGVQNDMQREAMEENEKQRILHKK